MTVQWDDNGPETWSSEDYSFGSLNSPIKDIQYKEHTIILKKDGWKKYKETVEPNLVNTPNYISINMQKVAFGKANILKFCTFPGLSQYELYQTKNWRKLQAVIYGVLVTYFARQGYQSYKLYKDASKDYDHYKMKYESLSDQYNNSEFNYYYTKAELSHQEMTGAFNDFQINTGGLALVYSINLAEIIQSWIIFSK